ncbi:MAG: hypothetical protein ACKV19_16275 [Verrucomicrobiales bacterium]
MAPLEYSPKRQHQLGGLLVMVAIVLHVSILGVVNLLLLVVPLPWPARLRGRQSRFRFLPDWQSLRRGLTDRFVRPQTAERVRRDPLAVGSAGFTQDRLGRAPTASTSEKNPTEA